jgi:hypothetical protein
MNELNFNGPLEKEAEVRSNVDLDLGHGRGRQLRHAYFS